MFVGVELRHVVVVVDADDDGLQTVADAEVVVGERVQVVFVVVDVDGGDDDDDCDYESFDYNSLDGNLGDREVDNSCC